tara:strand:- start:1748 stop:2662 length:915 start_codon:yes stop_codon:yes gene_type:complete
MLKVAVILCTCNSEKYILDQLQSIIDQKDCQIDIYISDDFSDDNTLEIVSKFFNNKEYYINIIDGPNKGFAVNFISNLRRVNNFYDLYAFSDHDDVWKKNKIQEAYKEFIQYPRNEPFLYCSRTTLVRENLKVFGASKYFKKRPSFGNALVQSIAGGNTMIFNGEFKKYLDRVDLNKRIISHDWLSYILITFIGGNIVYKKKSHTMYRIHELNKVGSNKGFIAFWKRVAMVFNGQWSLFFKYNLQHLDDFSGLNDNEDTLKDFKEIINERNIIKSLLIFLRSKIYRQTFIGNLSLIIAIILRKI